MSHYARNQPVVGTPRELACWAHASLERRKCGKSFALVLTDRTKAELVDPDSAKFRRIEGDRPADVVGHYTGYHKRPPRLTVDDFEADIRMTLEGV